MSRLQLVLIILLISCSNKLNIANEEMSLDCNQDTAKKTCIDYLKRHKLLGFEPVAELIDSADTYVVTILPKSIDIKGGGGKFIIAKDSCKIIKAELYQ